MIQLGQATSINVLALNLDGTKTEIDMTSRVAALSPQLAAGTFLGIIRNTMFDLTEGENGTVIYRFQLKADSKLYIHYDQSQGKSIQVIDPRSDSFNDVEEIAVRVNPELHGFKYKITRWDGDMNTVGNLLSNYVSSFVGVRHVKRQIQAFSKLLTSVKAISITGDPTLFADGAHIEYTKTAADMPTADEIYKAFSDCLEAALDLGLETAIGKENQEYGHAIGTNYMDWICVMTPRIANILKTKNGIFNSAPGFEAFSSFGLQAILGINVYISNVLPKGVHFMFLTTGANGTIGFTQASMGLGGIIYPDPDAMGYAYRLWLRDHYTLGVVLPFQAYVYAQKTTTKSQPKLKANKVSKIKLEADSLNGVEVGANELKKAQKEFNEVKAQLKSK